MKKKKLFYLLFLLAGINVPKTQSSANEDKNSKEKESARGRQVNPPLRGGRQAVDSEDYENVNVQDEIEHWLAKVSILTKLRFLCYKTN